MARKQLQASEAKGWVDQFALPFWMADRLFGLGDKKTVPSINDRIREVFDVLAGLDALRRAPVKPAPANAPDDLTDTQERLRFVAYGMLQFAASHYAFVIDSFYTQRYFDIQETPVDTTFEFNRNELGDLAEIPDGFAAYALRGVLSKVCADVMNLHAIWTQYAQDTSAPVQAGLAEGNKIAAFAGNQLSMFFTDVEHPIVYVRSTSGTRLLPYSSVPLISIPPTAVIVGDGTLRVCDAMSILHELGHFLFWRGALPGSGEPIHTDLGARLEALRASNNRCLHWVEEIFADVVAALLGGPYAVRCLMDMQREKVGRLFVQDDGHYPIPAVRPFAALHVLDLLGVDITEMETRWTTTTLKSWLPKKIGFDPQDPDSYGLSLRMMEQAVVREEPATVASPNLKNIREDVMAIAQLVYDMLSEGMTTSIIAQFTDVWRSRYEQGASGEDVVEAMRSAAPMSAATASRHWVKWHAAVAQDRLKSNQTALQSTDTFNDLKWVTDVLSTPEIDDTQGESQAMFKLTLDEWRDILYFGGWGDAGPTGGSPHEID